MAKVDAFIQKFTPKIVFNLIKYQEYLSDEDKFIVHKISTKSFSKVHLAIYNKKLINFTVNF